SAELIFSQDPLRILRALRQSLQLNFKIEEETFKALKNSVSRINIVSPERIRDELNKILTDSDISSGRFPSEAFVIMSEIGLLKEILPEVDILKGVTQPAKYHDKDVFFHTLDVLNRAAGDLTLSLAALLHDTGKYYTAASDESGKISFIGHEAKSAEIARNVLLRFKYSTDIIEKVVFIVENHMRSGSYSDVWTDAAVRRYYKKTSKYFPVLEIFAQIDYGKQKPDERIAALVDRIESLHKAKKLTFNENLITGDDIINFLGVTPISKTEIRVAPKGGKWVGEVKRYINEMQIENPALSREELLSLCAKFLEEKKL
ncbi:MAG: HD domain-containing protein, partial [Elusimicrobia bacterium]|nr:HD domain-containing protein [Elusimicrobiota bacterium]